MRRTDREITDIHKIEEILKQCVCCRIGFCDQGEIYIVPLNFGFEKRNGSYVLYFHGAKEGRKADLIQEKPTVGFEMDTNYALTGSDTACTYTARFRSIIGNGVICEVTETDEKRHGLSLIMDHNTGKKDWTFAEQEVHAVGVFKLTVTKMSCKEHA
ncbi:MAG: pyridoxamine 5'-phosphate oxidase family protein [Acutalibacteraceae bacterium]